ncbi:uncharacterized protein [Dendrobates tinctorius]|uniref:uncharacterized protein n=1 Tax=Dendrobates tinctorius TaxID=92724 RepID=UPI003CCA1984
MSVYQWYLFSSLFCVFTAFSADQMDFKAREKTWLLQLDKVFNSGSCVVVDSKNRDLTELTIKYKELLQRRIRLWWNKSFLERYISCGPIPRGLRVQIFPSFSIECDQFRNQWEEIASTCSKGFMGLLISNNEGTLSEIDKDLILIQDEINKNLTPETSINFKNEIDNEIEKWEKDIVSVKTKKYQRDSMDAQNNRVYRWRSSLNRRSTSRARSVSFSSVSSVDERSGASDINRMGSDRSDGKDRWQRTTRFSNKRKKVISPQKDKRPKNNTLEH